MDLSIIYLIGNKSVAIRNMLKWLVASVQHLSLSDKALIETKPKPKNATLPWPELDGL